MLLCPWDFPGKSTRVGCHIFLQGIFPTQGAKLCLLHCRWILYSLSHQGNSKGNWTNPPNRLSHLLRALYLKQHDTQKQARIPASAPEQTSELCPGNETGLIEPSSIWNKMWESSSLKGFIKNNGFGAKQLLEFSTVYCNPHSQRLWHSQENRNRYFSGTLLLFWRSNGCWQFRTRQNSKS